MLVELVLSVGDESICSLPFPWILAFFWQSSGSLVYWSISPISAFMCTWYSPHVCMSMSKFLLFMRIPHVLHQKPRLPQATPSVMTLFQIRSHSLFIPRYLAIGLQHTNFEGDTIQSVTVSLKRGYYGVNGMHRFLVADLFRGMSSSPRYIWGICLKFRPESQDVQGSVFSRGSMSVPGHLGNLWLPYLKSKLHCLGFLVKGLFWCIQPIGVR